MSLRIAVYPTKQLWDLLTHGVQLTLVNIGSGNGLVPSGNKPLPESVLTYVVTWCD